MQQNEIKMRQVIKNMELYSEQNLVTFTKNDFPESTHITFYEFGCFLDFVVYWTKNKVKINQFSEDSSLDGKTISFEEFKKFQYYFTN